MLCKPFTHDERLAIEMFCAGDESFFLTYRQACHEQFRLDMAQGQEALLSGDVATFKRTVHSLKGVLRSLGQPAVADQAARMEAEVTPDTLARCEPEWARICLDIAAMYDGDTDEFSNMENRDEQA